MPRNDLRGSVLAPANVTDFLSRVGGLNPYREPNYRLIIASARYMQVGGEFQEWDPNLSLPERGGMTLEEIDLDVPEPIFAPDPVQTKTGNKLLGYTKTRKVMVPSQNKPQSVFVGIKEVPRYACFEGWILERWYPAHLWGTREQWEQHTLHDGTPLLGPYPEEGDYDSVVGPWESVPGLSILQQSIDYVEDKIHNNHYSTAARRAKRIAAAESQQAERDRKFKENVAQFIKDKTSFLTGTSLEAGRLREEAAKRLGIRHHIGN